MLFNQFHPNIKASFDYVTTLCCITIRSKPCCASLLLSHSMQLQLSVWYFVLRTMLCYVMLCCAVPCYTALHCTVLCCAVLCCAVLCCVVLCWLYCKTHQFHLTETQCFAKHKNLNSFHFA